MASEKKTGSRLDKYLFAIQKILNSPELTGKASVEKKFSEVPGADKTIAEVLPRLRNEITLQTELKIKDTIEDENIPDRLATLDELVKREVAKDPSMQQKWRPMGKPERDSRAQVCKERGNYLSALQAEVAERRQAFENLKKNVDANRKKLVDIEKNS